MNLERLTLNTPHHDANSDTAAVVANWHDDTHVGPFRTCPEQPCDAVRSVDR